MSGMLVGWAVCLWWSLGRIVHGAAPEFTQTLAVSVEGCPTNFSAGSGYKVYETTTMEIETYRLVLTADNYCI